MNYNNASFVAESPKYDLILKCEMEDQAVILKYFI